MQRNRDRAEAARGGFTLVELVVVLAILMLLMSLVLPGLVSAREGALRTVCATRIRELFQPFERYAQRNRDHYPAPWFDRPNSPGLNQWPYRISEEITGVRVSTDYTKRMHPGSVPYAFCPKMMSLGVWWWWRSSKEQAYTTYSLSVLVRNAAGQPDLALPAQRSRIPDPARTALLGDGDAPVGEYPGYPWMNAWMYYSNVRVHPHGKRSNYLFCDGHVEPLGDANIRTNLFIAY